MDRRDRKLLKVFTDVCTAIRAAPRDQWKRGDESPASSPAPTQTLASARRLCHMLAGEGTKEARSRVNLP